jgi:putative membrane protein insertion efficiency factor
MTAAEEPTRLTVSQRAALGLLRGYKILISPLFAGSCRFLPSCSDYAAEAVTRFGVIRGSLLAARRLSRCHPLGAHGLDPVPGRWPAVAALRLRRDKPRV